MAIFRVLVPVPSLDAQLFRPALFFERWGGPHLNRRSSGSGKAPTKQCSRYLQYPAPTPSKCGFECGVSFPRRASGLECGITASILRFRYLLTRYCVKDFIGWDLKGRGGKAPRLAIASAVNKARRIEIHFSCLVALTLVLLKQELAT